MKNNECCCWLSDWKAVLYIGKAQKMKRTNEPFMQIRDSVFYVHCFFYAVSFNICKWERENLLMLRNMRHEEKTITVRKLTLLLRFFVQCSTHDDILSSIYHFFIILIFFSWCFYRVVFTVKHMKRIFFGSHQPFSHISMNFFPLNDVLTVVCVWKKWNRFCGNNGMTRLVCDKYFLWLKRSAYCFGIWNKCQKCIENRVFLKLCSWMLFVCRQEIF